MSAPFPFSNLRTFFADDNEYGQLCDIKVPGATPRAWSALFDIIRSHPHRFSLQHETGDPTPGPLPADPMPTVTTALSDSGPWPSLDFDLADLFIRVHLFGPTWMELTFDRSAATPANYPALTGFMQRLGDDAAQDVFITPESDDCFAPMVYDAAQRRFREPRRAAARPGAARAHILTTFAAALAPIRHAAPPLSKPNARSRLSKARVLPDDRLRTALAAVERLGDSHTELQLQDELTLEERRDLDRALSLLGSIVHPGVGIDRTPDHPAYERDLIALSNRVVRR